MTVVEHDNRQDDTDESYQLLELNLSQVHFFLTPYSTSVFFFLLTGLALPGISVLCIISQHCIHLFPKSLNSGRTDRKQSYQCYYVPAPVFQYRPRGASP